MGHRSTQATLIFNPIAGYWDWSAVVRRVAQFWQERGWELDVQPTVAEGHATELARAAAQAGHGVVFAAGGDGTLNEVANGLAHTQTILAPLPVGTANSFAKELGLARPHLLNPNWLLEVSEALAAGQVHRLDLGKCSNGRYWMLWASTGFDGFVVRRIEPRTRWFKRLGPLGYLAKMLYFLPRFRGSQAVVTVDGRTFEDEFILVNISNCRMFAGGELRLNSNGVLDDGAFEVWLFRGRDWPQVLTYSFDISRAAHVNHPNVASLRGRNISVQSNNAMDYHLDGEPAGVTPFSCELVDRALRLLVPNTAPQDLFHEPGEAL